MKKILLIIPAYNEEGNILKTYNSIVKYNKEHKTNYDVVVINDGSTDNTEKILLENNIKHIELIQNLGIGGAVQTGYKYAYDNDYDIAIQFDGDGQHDINYVEDIVDPILNGESNLVIGSRFVDKKSSGFKSSKLRRVGISIISSFIKYRTHKKIYDTTSGFRAADKEVIKEFSILYPLEYPEPISTVRVILNGHKVSEVPVSMKEREHGKSSIRAWKNAYYMINVCLSILMLKGGKK